MTGAELYNASMLLDANLAAGRADKLVVACGDDHLTYGELYRRACGIGAMLRDRGIEQDGRVLMVMDDCVDFPAVFLGAMRIGAVPIPVNPLLAADEYDYYVSDSGAEVVLVDAASAGKVTDPRVIHVDELRTLDDDIPPAPTRGEGMAFWLYSSGSTGTPKGVIHRHRDLLVTWNYATTVLAIQEDDVAFSTTKLFHAYGLGNNLTFPYIAGATTVMLAGRATPEAVFATIAKHRPTIFFSAPTLFNAMLHADAAGEQDLSSVRLCVSAAEPLPAEVWHRWYDRYGVEIIDGIGSTEMLHIYCSNRPGVVVPGSSGTAVPGYELKLCDDEERELVGEATGDLCVRGESMFVEYWNQPERTAQLIRDGWFHTRDRYRRDADGNYWYEGRADDMFKVSGLWVSPADVEARLIEHPAVVEAAVVSCMIDGFIKAKAFVVAEPSAAPGDQLNEELREFCCERLHRYQVPTVFAYVESLPKTVTGKIQRFKLRQS